MSQMNQGPASGQSGSSMRPGQMTAVMKAISANAGPKVLRIGVVSAGRILEERIIKQRTTVTVGSNERAMFVLQAPNLPAQFKLFELTGGDYYLNFLDGMTGRVALQTGISDLTALRGQAKKVGQGYQVKLTEDARGKVIIGDTTLLFQFVAPPPVQPRPQLPLSVKGGVASQIDWNLTIIAAFSFLIHFGLVGAMYSDWMDPVVNEDVTAGLIDMIKSAAPPPIETAEPTPTATAAENPTKAPTQKAPTNTTSSKPSAEQKAAQEAKMVAGLVNEAEKTKLAILGAFGGGTALAGMLKDGNGAAVSLSGLASSSSGVSNTSSGLNLGGGGGPLRPGAGGGGLAGIRGGETKAVEEGAGKVARVVPVGNVDIGAAQASVPVANAEAVIRRDIHPRAKRCYQKGLESDPTMSGKIVILIKVGPSGEVESASVTSKDGSLSDSVANCIRGAAKQATFEKPGGSGSQISLPFNFVKSGG